MLSVLDGDMPDNGDIAICGTAIKRKPALVFSILRRF
jgi:hypothetical protein